MGRKPNCTPEEIERLFELRDVRKLVWREIVDIVGGTEAGLCARYIYYKKKLRCEAMRTGKPVPATPQKFRGVEVTEVRPVAIASEPPRATPPAPAVTQVEKRPRYFHHEDADIMSRINRQGLTAGFCGDPPPGRSALDQKRTGP